MAVIVGVHGIAQQYGGGVQLGSVWFNALRDGLITARHRVTGGPDPGQATSARSRRPLRQPLVAPLGARRRSGA